MLANRTGRTSVKGSPRPPAAASRRSSSATHPAIRGRSRSDAASVARNGQRPAR